MTQMVCLIIAVCLCITYTDPTVVRCEPRWELRAHSQEEERFNVTVRWDPPEKLNGNLLGYRLKIVTFTGETVVRNVMAAASSNSLTFTNLNLSTCV